jgi:hypothetical protein
MIEPGLRVLTREQLRLNGTSTLAVAWVGVIVYGALCCLQWIEPIMVFTWLGIITHLIVSWAVMERKRWARLAMIGICSVLVADMTVAAWLLILSPDSVTSAVLRGSSYWTTLLNVYGCGTVFGLILFVLSMGSIWWLSRNHVREEFDRRKKRETSRFQGGIAAALVCIVLFGTVCNGASHDIEAKIQSQQARMQRSKSTKLYRMRYAFNHFGRRARR